jgi:hypothetical protein
MLIDSYKQKLNESPKMLFENKCPSPDRSGNPFLLQKKQ